MSSTARNRALACAFVHRPSPLGAFSFFTIVASDSDLLSSRAIGGRESVMVDPLAINPEPVGGSFKQLLPTLLFDVAMPIIGFYVLTSLWRSDTLGVGSGRVVSGEQQSSRLDE